MPRQPRIDLPGIAQHIVQRGNDRQPCFFNPADYQHPERGQVHLSTGATGQRPAYRRAMR